MDIQPGEHLKNATDAAFLQALDALLAGDWRTIQQKWGEGNLAAWLWRTILMSDDRWFRDVDDRLANLPLQESARPSFMFMLKSVQWSLGCSSDGRWLLIILGGDLTVLNCQKPIELKSFQPFRRLASPFIGGNTRTIWTPPQGIQSGYNGADVSQRVIGTLPG